MRIVPDNEDSDREVMTSLPRTRPVRRSPKRGARAASGAGATTTATATAKKAKAAGSTATGGAKKSKAAKSKSGGAKSASAKASGAKASGKGKAKAPLTDPPRIPRAEEPPVTPRRKVPAAGYAAPSSSAGGPESAVADLVTTSLQAAQELARIGLDVGRAAVRSMLDRLPKA